MVLIRAETLVPYGCTCDGSAVDKDMVYSKGQLGSNRGAFDGSDTPA
jgi:hypothetical protein